MPDVQERDNPEATQKFMYHAGGKLSRFLARIGGTDPDAAEQAWKDGTAQLTAGADPVLIGEAINDGIDLGFGLVEKRRALREYHRRQVAREHGPPAYDTEEIWEDDELVGLRVLVSEPGCRFFTNDIDDELLVRRAGGGEALVPLGFTPGEIETVEDTDSISEVIVRPVVEHDIPVETEQPDEDAEMAREDYLDAAREVVLEDPERALVAEGGEDSATGMLVSALLERKPSVSVEDAPNVIHKGIKHVGLDTIKERYDELIEQDTDEGDDEEPERDDAGDES